MELADETLLYWPNISSAMRVVKFWDVPGTNVAGWRLGEGRGFDGWLTEVSGPMMDRKGVTANERLNRDNSGSTHMSQGPIATEPTSL